MMGREKSGEGKEQFMIQSTTSCVKHGGGSVMGWACMAVNQRASLMFMTEETNSRQFEVKEMGQQRATESGFSAWQSISREETQNVVRSMGCRLQEVNGKLHIFVIPLKIKAKSLRFDRN